MRFVAVPGSHRIALNGARVLQRTDPRAVIEVLLKLRRKNPLPDLVRKVDPPLTHEELAETYGATHEDAEAVTRALTELGINVGASDLGTRSLLASGPVSAMEQAFNLHLFDYEHLTHGNYRGYVGAVHVPAHISEQVVGVFGLDNRRAVRRRPNQVRSASNAPRSLEHAVPASWYTPEELAQHYGFPAGDGTGETIGVLEFGGGYFSSDLKAFCKLVNVPMPKNVHAVSTDGIGTYRKDGAEGEVMLDIEVVAGACPKATIVAYFGHFTIKWWITALDKAVHDTKYKPTVLSVSWGYAEDNYIWTDQAMEQINQSLLEAAHLGITVCVAAGDDGSSDGITDGRAYADFPSTSPYALAVGGTGIPSKATQQADIVWKDGSGVRPEGGSTGGGVSSHFDLPSWQQAAGINIPSVNPGAKAGRVVPDIAANADPAISPFVTVVDGQMGGYGGTSASAPLIAAMIARINGYRRGAGKSRVGFLTPQLYGLIPNQKAIVGSVGCTDVISGDNKTAHAGGYVSAKGFDAVSGWGTPNGKLADLLP